MSVELGGDNTSGADGVIVSSSEDDLFGANEDEEFCPIDHATFDRRGIL